MRIWIYGDSLEQIKNMIEVADSPSDIIVGTSVCAGVCSTFPRSGLAPAISAAVQGKLDLLLIPTFKLPGLEAKSRMAELFKSYGVAVKSASSCGINNS